MLIQITGTKPNFSVSSLWKLDNFGPDFELWSEIQTGIQMVQPFHNWTLHDVRYLGPVFRCTSENWTPDNQKHAITGHICVQLLNVPDFRCPVIVVVSGCEMVAKVTILKHKRNFSSLVKHLIIWNQYSGNLITGKNSVRY
jgi:hypothetical protein